MEEELLPRDFKEFLRLLNDADAQYLLIGGYAVGYYGYPRSTAAEQKSLRLIQGS